MSMVVNERQIHLWIYRFDTTAVDAAGFAVRIFFHNFLTISG